MMIIEIITYFYKYVTLTRDIFQCY